MKNILTFLIEANTENIVQTIIIKILIFSFLSSNIIAQNIDIPKKFLRFDCLDIKDGLSQSTVLKILQDKKGFLWFCTEDGLNRYDGYSFKIYKNDPENLNSISNNYIFTAYEDHSGFLWFGTADGLNKFNPKNEQFTQYKFDANDSTGLSGKYVLSIYESPRNPGMLWIGTSGGLNKLITNDTNSETSSSFSHYRYNPKESNCISNDVVMAIKEDNSGLLWLGTSDGLNKFNADNGKFTWYKSDSLNQNSLSDNFILEIYIDSSGTLWVGTNNGLNKLLPENMDDTSPSFVRYKNYPGNPNSLSHNHICSIFESSSGVLWIGTQDGLNKIVAKKSESSRRIFIRYKRETDNPSSLVDSWVHSIYEDRSGILWLGTMSGINMLNPKKNKFSLYQHQSNNANSLSSNFVSGIFEDSNGMLWVGTVDEGLNLFDKERRNIIHYKNNPNDPYSISSNRIRDVLEDSSGKVWIGTRSEGLNQFDYKSKKFIHFKHDPSDETSISDDYVLSLYKDSADEIWIGTRFGLNKFDKKHNSFIRYINDPANFNGLCNNFVRAIDEDESGYLWIGTDDGLDKIDRGTGKFIHYKTDPNNPHSLLNNRIISVYADHTGNLWIGTGGGLSKFNMKENIFTNYRLEDGLPNEIIYGILEDSQNNLWLSTNNGLSKFNPQLESFYNYDVEDGLQSNEFNATAFFKSKSGEMFFGGVNGFNAFYPEEIKQSNFIPPIVITSFLKLNKEEQLGNPISEMNQLELSYKDYLFSFEFVSLDYQAPQKNKYAYKMEGLDEDWIYVSAEKRFASYTTLPPGDYVFKVKGSNSDGIWNETGTSINIIITPPFWQTWWFRTSVVIVLIVLLVVLYKYRISKIEEKKRLLEIQVREKTESALKIKEALSEVEKLKNQLQAENIYLQDEIKIVHNFENIISTSESFKKILHKVEQVSSTDATVLILGESGTGKELLARAVHSLSSRKNKPLIKVNCATLPTNLIESELFGHEKGAFTGAFTRKIGRFELAEGGTIFLDEIGDLQLDLQTKLLRVLQESEFERVGGTTSIKVDVRVIAATNRDLENALKQGVFREDLYYRLNVFPIKIPPLRERKEDIPVLVNHFIIKHCKEVGKKIESISPKLMNNLLKYHWPGNVRELENVIQRSVIVSTTNQLHIEDSISKIGDNNNYKDYQSLEVIERNYIIKVLESTNWRVSGPKGAAKILGLLPSTLEYKMKKLQVHRP